MIQIFLCQEIKVNKTGYTYKYIYFYDIATSNVWLVNPWSGEQKITDNGSLSELHYKDNVRERIHKYLIDWEE